MPKRAYRTAHDEAKVDYAATAAEAAQAAAELGGEVALKAVAPGLLHKSDVGGVHLGTRDLRLH